MTTGPSLSRQVGVALLGSAAILIWLAAGLLVVLSMAVTPDPGQDNVVLVLQLAMVAGWLATLAWLLRDLMAGNLRLVAAPIVAWCWMWAMGELIGGISVFYLGH